MIKLTDSQIAIFAVGSLVGYGTLEYFFRPDLDILAGTVGGNIGPDGVKQIYPSLAGGKEFYLGTNPDRTRFNVSYGGGSHLPFTAKTEAGLVFFNTTGNPISYHSGAKSGRSVRLDIYPDGGIWSNKTPYSWKSNPGYLYTPNGIASGEYTVYLRPHGALGSHQSCAWKLGGRDEDAIRSLFEICAADGTHPKPYAHWDYQHFPYVSCPVTITGQYGKLTPEQWYGVKAVRIVDPSRKFCDFYLYEDTMVNGKPANNWRMIAHAHDQGTSGYGNVPCTWKSHKDLMRVDGFQSVDFALISTRPIAVGWPGGAAAPPSATLPPVAIGQPGLPPPTPAPPTPVSKSKKTTKPSSKTVPIGKPGLPVSMAGIDLSNNNFRTDGYSERAYMLPSHIKKRIRIA